MHLQPSDEFAHSHFELILQDIVKYRTSYLIRFDISSQQLNKTLFCSMCLYDQIVNLLLTFDQHCSISISFLSVKRKTGRMETTTHPNSKNK